MTQLLTHNPEAEETAAAEACAGGELADRVLYGELVTGPYMTRELSAGAPSATRWLHRSTEWSPPHHAIRRYLADEEAPVGTRFDIYV